MLLYFHDDPKGNFGDDLNPWLWPKLLPGAFDGMLAHDPRDRVDPCASETLFIGIGTLINQRVPKDPRKVVFGTGAGYGPPPQLDSKWKIYCVRGPVTAEMLGLDDSMAVTDPAILVRTIYQSSAPRSQRIAYMPHCSSARSADWSSICADLDLTFIDPQHQVDDVLSAISSAPLLITEALHGAIVADALRVPWVPVSASPAILDVKWHDWCQSVGLTYSPEKLPALWQPRREASFVAKSRWVVKRKLATILLGRIKRNCRPLLSSDQAIGTRTEQLQERLAQFELAFR